MRYSISNEQITISVDTHGAELKSLIKDQKEYLWQADPAFWARTSPVLFPMVGSLKDKSMTSHGTIYSMGQHGFARDMEFAFVSKTENALSFVLESGEETKKLYPYDFKLTITYTIEASTVRVDWKVENPARETMYFSIGAHPAFNCVQDGAAFVLENADGTRAEELQYYLLNEKGTVHPETLVKEIPSGILPINQALFLNDALICTESKVRKVSLVDKTGNTFVTVTYDSDCDCFGLWSPAGKNAPFVCIEPWYGTADYEDTDGIWEHKKHLHTLAAGAAFERGYDITI